MNRLLLLLTLFGFAFATACGDETPTSATGSDAGGGTSLSIAGDWTLTSLVVDGEDVAVPPGLTITVQLGEISGDAGCNNFGGTIDRGDDGSLSIDEMFWTEMACDRLDFEQVYLNALTSATNWAGSPEGIAFSGPNFTATYTGVAPVPAAALEGTTWQFDSIYQGSGVERAVSSIDQSAPGVTLSIGFADDASSTAVLRSDGCEPLSLSVTVEPGGEGPFTIDEPATPVVCEGSGSNLEAAFEGLQAATGYMINEQRLTFIGLEGETVGFMAL